MSKGLVLTSNRKPNTSSLHLSVSKQRQQTELVIPWQSLSFLYQVKHQHSADNSWWGSSSPDSSLCQCIARPGPSVALWPPLDHPSLRYLMTDRADVPAWSPAPCPSPCQMLCSTDAPESYLIIWDGMCLFLEGEGEIRKTGYIFEIQI